MGSGTQQVEEELKRLFPDKTVARVDMDTMSKKGSYEKLHREMHDGTIDIVVGTQILAKGMDFPKVTLVGVLNADVGLHIPDFRAHERTFQLLYQVVGRVSRQGQDGAVIIQTFDPENKIINYALKKDLDGFYAYELGERQLYSYPPYAEMVQMSFVDVDQEKVKKQSMTLFSTLEDSITKDNLPIEIYHAPSAIPKKYGKFHYHVLLKGQHVRTFLEGKKLPSGVRVDVDPQHVD